MKTLLQKLALLCGIMVIPLLLVIIFTDWIVIHSNLGRLLVGSIILVGIFVFCKDGLAHWIPSDGFIAEYKAILLEIFKIGIIIGLVRGTQRISSSDVVVIFIVALFLEASKEDIRRNAREAKARKAQIEREEFMQEVRKLKPANKDIENHSQ